MQPKLPCSLCLSAFREKALVAYHAWYQGEMRVCYKQRMCLRCWRRNYAELVQHSIDTMDNETPEPEACFKCGERLGADAENLYGTWYRGQQRKDVIATLCPGCATDYRQQMMQGADRQEDRATAGVGAGGAPRPNPRLSEGGSDLPW